MGSPEVCKTHAQHDRTNYNLFDLLRRPPCTYATNNNISCDGGVRPKQCNAVDHNENVSLHRNRIGRIFITWQRITFWIFIKIYRIRKRIVKMFFSFRTFTVNKSTLIICGLFFFLQSYGTTLRGVLNCRTHSLSNNVYITSGTINVLIKHNYNI